MDALVEARAWVLSAPTPAPVPFTLKVALRFGSAIFLTRQLSYASDGHTATVRVSSGELAAFDDVRAAGAAVASLGVSLDGACATPLHNFVQGLVGEKLRRELGEEAAAPPGLCVQCGEFVYGLELLHHAPEVLQKKGAEARLLALPLSFPWNAGAVEARLEPLQLLLRAEASYYAGHAAAGERAEALEAALGLLERASGLRPGHLQVELRRAAVLSRLGRRGEAARALVAQQKATPEAARLYWRAGTLLAGDESTLRTALVTLHGSARFGAAASRLYYPRLVSLARRCVLLLWGSAALGSRAGFLPNGVLQMVLDKLPIWDVLRMSCVCFSWATFASQESYWRRRLARDWTSEQLRSLFGTASSSKETYRLMMQKVATRICAQGYATMAELGRANGAPHEHRLWSGELRDAPRFVWRAWLRYIERLDLPPAHCVLVTNKLRFSEGRFWTLAGAVLGPETLPFGRVAFVPSVAVGYQYCSACHGLVDPNDVDAMCTALIHPQYPATAKEIEVLLSSPKWTAESKAVRRKLRDFCDDCLNNKNVTARNVASVHPCCAQKPGALGCSLRRHNPQKWSSPVFKEVITAVPAPPMQQGKKAIVLLNLAPVVIREDNWFGELDMMHARQVGYNVTTALHEHGKPQ